MAERELNGMNLGGTTTNTTNTTNTITTSINTTQ